MEATDYIATSGRVVFDDKHDVKWGPGYVTAPGVQWQGSKLVGVWPPADGSWNGVKYEGIVSYQLPPWMVEYWTKR
jgi:branched-chain amino acid transport system substrate-binding protein